MHVSSTPAKSLQSQLLLFAKAPSCFPHVTTLQQADLATIKLSRFNNAFSPVDLTLIFTI